MVSFIMGYSCYKIALSQSYPRRNSSFLEVSFFCWPQVQCLSVRTTTALVQSQSFSELLVY